MIALIVFSAIVNGSSYYIDPKTILYAFMHTYKISEGTCKKKTTEFSTSLIFKGENTSQLLLLINSLDENLIICLLYQHHI